MNFKSACAGLALLLGASPVLAQQGELPLKYTGPATVPAVTAGDLMTRLYQYADDSMMGRQVGTEHHLRATAYLEREVRRLGLTPAGEDGGFFQNIGVMTRALDTASSVLTIDGVTYKAGVDFLASASGAYKPATNAGVVVWGTVFDTVGSPTPEQYKGKFVLIRNGTPPAGFRQADFLASAGYKRFTDMLNSPDVAGVLSVSPGDLSPNAVRNSVNPPRGVRISRDMRPVALNVTPRVAEAIFGGPASAAAIGSTGKAITLDARFRDSQPMGRNVIAKVTGSDPKLRGQYVVIGAHNDHIGLFPRALDHDSVKLANIYFKPQGADSRNSLELMKDQAKWTLLNAKLDSIRKIRPPRADSIFNGADDDGSGSVALLEIAEAFANGNLKPKRSIILIWHAGEEAGMWGSSFFAHQPTVPRDSIVAQINIDMVGRGGPDDITGNSKEGGEVKGDVKYVQLVGSRRLSKELGDLMETVNSDAKYGFRFDYALDANGHPQNIYCRSDHASYAAYGIPVVFFTTGGHADYHQVTDEAQYIRYDHLSKLTQFMLDGAMRLANLDHRVKVDKTGPFDPEAACQQ